MKVTTMLAALVPLLATHLALADVTTDTFATDPILGGRATVVGDATRFTYDAGSKTITAAYDSTKPTAKLVFPLASPINQNRSFTYSTTFTINSISNFDHPGNTTPPYGTNQIAFGLFNSTLTGSDRAGGNAYDIATVDYFPDNTGFGPPSLAATVIKTSQSPGDFFSQIDFDFTPAANIPTFLNTNVPIGATVSYDALTAVITASFSASQLTIDASNPNTFTYTHALTLGPGQGFNFDSFGFTLWNDTDSINAGTDVPLTASLTFGGFSVNASSPIPEPASLGVLAAGSLLLLRRRK